MASSFTLPFLKKEKIAKDTFSFYFDRTKNWFNFRPGEYLRMTLDVKNPDSRGSYRYFTIASSPNDPEFIVITTKIIRSSFKKRLANLKKYENVNFFGPLGNFVVDEKSKKTLVFLAGGIGITTFYSMIKYLALVKFSSLIILIASFSKREDVIYEEELIKLAEKNKNIHIYYVLTDDKSWSGEKGRINEEKIKRLVPSLKSEYYVVGSPQMVEEVGSMLNELGIKKDNIHKEDFTGY